MPGSIGDFDAIGCGLIQYSGGAGGIRTLDRALQPYNGLANRRLQPLGHSSVKADMPDAGPSRKQRFGAIESVSQIGPSRPSNRGYGTLSSPRVGSRITVCTRE